MNYMQISFESILIEYGHDVYLQKRLIDLSCEEGFRYGPLQKQTVRHRANNRSVMGAQEEEMEGILSTSDRIYYFRLQATPFDGDRIYEVNDPRAPDGQTVWSIDASIPMRGINGELVYYVAGATRIQPN